MAEWISDGFDFYTTIADATLGYWDTALASVSSTTRFSTGQSVSYNGGVSGAIGLSKAVGTNDAVVFITVAHFQSLALGASGTGWGWVLADGATSQCGIWFEQDGAVRLRAGGTIAGSVLATYSSAFVSSVWNHFQVKITINNTTGAVSIRKNGTTSDDFAATGLNTRASANNYANKISFITGSSTTNFARFDDLLVYSSTGAAPNDWVGDVRCKSRYPVTDTATKNFAPFPATYTGGNSSVATTGTLTNGKVQYSTYAPAADGTVGTMVVNFNAAFTGHVKVALYDATGTAGAPGARLGISNEITNPTIGDNTFTFASPPGVLSGTSYYMAVIADGAAVLKAATATAVGQYNETLTYAGGFGATASPTNASFAVFNCRPVITPYNAWAVSEATQDGDTTYVALATVGSADYYNIDPDTTTPTTIVGYKARMLTKKTDVNAKTARLQFLGTTTPTTADLVLATSYQWCSTAFMPTDPDTGLAWSAAVSPTVGPKVQA